MQLTLEYLAHRTGNMDQAVHATEVDGIKFATPSAMLDHNGLYTKERIGGLFYVSGVRPLTWHDGKQYVVATVEWAERHHISLYDHDGWQLCPGSTENKRCYVPSLGMWLEADRKSRFIKSQIGVTRPGSIWVGNNKRRGYYFAGLNSASELRIRTGELQPR